MTRDVLFFRAAILRHAPQRYALMLTPAEARRLDQKYDERRGAITDVMLARHLAGEIALAAPAAVDSCAHLLPLDVDAGGLAAICALIAEAHRRDLWAFGQYCPRAGLAEQEQRGYVWLPFDQLVDKDRLQKLGDELITATAQPGWKIDARAHAAVTRLPMAHHTHTGRFGDLVLADRVISIDADPAGALAELRQCYRENPVSSLPTPPLPAPQPQQEQKKQPSQSTHTGISIDRYNQDNDLITLLESYGARPARGSRRLMHCCGHADERRASLLLWKDRDGKLKCKCLSEHHSCPLAGQMRDPFGVYCAMEGLAPVEALRRLNGR
jgi:hypothetical protein